MQKNTATTTVLVVIDMQTFFYNRGLRNHNVSPEQMKKDWIGAVKAIQKEIRQAKKNHDFILIVECSGFFPGAYGQTDGRIRQTIGKYQHVRYVKKDFDDGSAEIEDMLIETQRNSPERFRVCGINRAYCVASTVKGLADKYVESKILLVDDAITDEHGNMGWGGATRLRNTVVV